MKVLIMGSSDIYGHTFLREVSSVIIADVKNIEEIIDLGIKRFYEIRKKYNWSSLTNCYNYPLKGPVIEFAVEIKDEIILSNEEIYEIYLKYINDLLFDGPQVLVPNNGFYNKYTKNINILKNLSLELINKMDVKNLL